MVQGSAENIDPRIRRTRQLLHHSLEKLLQKKTFDEISVNDITEEATLNRATFYDHYADKFALLECVVAGRFNELLAERQVHFDGTCSSALNSFVLAVCEYLIRLQGPGEPRQFEPHMELAIISVVKRILLDGLKQHPAQSAITPELKAATVSWAMYGAAKEWARTANRPTAEDMAATVSSLLSPVLHLA